jgi:hypothetical protein
MLADRVAADTSNGVPKVAKKLRKAIEASELSAAARFVGNAEDAPQERKVHFHGPVYVGWISCTPLVPDAPAIPQEVLDRLLKPEDESKTKG